MFDGIILLESSCVLRSLCPVNGAVAFARAIAVAVAVAVAVAGATATATDRARPKLLFADVRAVCCWY